MAEQIDTDEQAVAWDPEAKAYRIVKTEIKTVTVAGQEHSFEVHEFGPHAVWVDEAPDNPEDGAGRFERYHGSHENYAAIRKAEED